MTDLKRTFQSHGCRAAIGRTRPLRPDGQRVAVFRAVPIDHRYLHRPIIRSKRDFEHFGSFAGALFRQLRKRMVCQQKAAA